jgi:hypothetical protein
VRGEHHHRHAGVLHAQRREDLHAVDVGHREIGQHHVGAVGLEVGDAGRPAVGGVHVEARVAENRLERETHRGLVVDNQDPARHGRTLLRNPGCQRAHTSRAQLGTFSAERATDGEPVTAATTAAPAAPSEARHGFGSWAFFDWAMSAQAGR